MALAHEQKRREEEEMGVRAIMKGANGGGVSPVVSSSPIVSVARPVKKGAARKVKIRAGGRTNAPSRTAPSRPPPQVLT